MFQRLKLEIASLYAKAHPSGGSYATARVITSAGLSLGELIEYTDWERSKWHDCLRERGDLALTTPAGSKGNNRFATVGDLIRHIFSAGKRYIDRLSNRQITDTSVIPNNKIRARFVRPLSASAPDRACERAVFLAPLEDASSAG